MAYSAKRRRPGSWGVGNSPFAGVVGINNGGFDFSLVGAPFWRSRFEFLCCRLRGYLRRQRHRREYCLLSATGVWGDYGGASASGFGVLGTADDNWAGAFYNNSSTHATVLGVNNATTGSAPAVGGPVSTAGTGVQGTSNAPTGTTYGVTGAAASTSGIGVFGYEAAPTGSTIGVLGQSQSRGGFGVQGTSSFVGVVGVVGAIGDDFRRPVCPMA